VFYLAFCHGSVNFNLLEVNNVKKQKIKEFSLH
jgi:hypothetical protein